jgi:hypothetical protein
MQSIGEFVTLELRLKYVTKLVYNAVSAGVKHALNITTCNNFNAPIVWLEMDNLTIILSA